MPWIEWHNSLAKPSWTPAPTTFEMIWQILYPIILVSFGFVFVQAIRKKLPWLVALPFAVNAMFKEYLRSRMETPNGNRRFPNHYASVRSNFE